MKYEYWYNWDYAQEHNPKLMHLGTSGGFGLTRRNMIEYVTQGNMERAERCFWKLVQETEWEWQCDTPCFIQEQQEWFERVMCTDVTDEQWDEIRHFIRPKDTTQQEPNKAPLKRRYPVGIMRDTLMDLNPDPMVVPTMATFKEWGKAESYAQDLRAFIEYVHDNDAMDPLDPAVIY